MIKTENLTRTYGKVVALKGIDLTINDGEMVVIIGKSGSGKSTLLNLLGGLDAPTEGKIFYNDTEIGRINDTELSRFRLNNVGFVFQFFDLISELTAEENILLPSRLAKKEGEGAEGLYSALDINDRIKHYPSELSGGQQQRAAIARALINSPDVLLCDEPTGNLDKRSGEEVMALLKELNGKGKTVIIVTHDDEVARQCQRVIEISDGEIVLSSIMIIVMHYATETDTSREEKLNKINGIIDNSLCNLTEYNDLLLRNDRSNPIRTPKFRSGFSYARISRKYAVCRC